MNGTELPNQEKIKMFEENENNKYVVIVEAYASHQTREDERNYKKEYFRRTKNLL